MKRLYSILTLFLASLGTVVVAQNPVLYTQGDLVTSAEDLTNGKYFISVACKGIEGFMQYNTSYFGNVKDMQSFPHGTTDASYLYEVILIDEENAENDGIRFYIRSCSSNKYLPIQGEVDYAQGNLKSDTDNTDAAARLTLGEIPYGDFKEREGYWLVYQPGAHFGGDEKRGISYLGNNGEGFDSQHLTWFDHNPETKAAGTTDLAAIAFYKAIEEESLSIQSAADLTTGYYVLDVLTSGTNGFMYYDEANKDENAKFRVRTGTSISNVLHDPNYYWKVEKSTDGTFTLQHVSTKVYLSNVGKNINTNNPNGNNNLIDPTDGNYKPAVLRIDNREEKIYTEDGEVRFGVYETTFPGGSEYRYLHTNTSNNSNIRIVSYHDSYSKDKTATAQKIAFYRVKALPEDGMAYRLHNVRPESNDESQTDNGYLLVDNGNEKLGIVEYTDDNKDNMNAIFVCHKVGDKYIFTNGEKGYYLALDGSKSSYKSTSNDFTLTSGASTRLGTFTLGIQSDEGTNSTIAISKENETASLKTYENGVIYNETTSNLFVLEPVDYPYNNVTLRTPTSQADGENYNYATLYLPFATTIPDGVEAYTATLEGDRLKLHAITETLLPANTAVVLRSMEMTEALFVPATTAGDNVETNDLMGTMATEETTPANTYVLSDSEADGIGFYPYAVNTLPTGKAYVVENSGVKGLFFGGQTATAIDSATAEGNVDADAPCYDLSGRRVAAPAKGIYVRDGKIVFIK